MKIRLGLSLLLSAARPASPAFAQDATRGERLFNDTASVTGQVVAPCAGCHGDVGALRVMIINRGGRVDQVPRLANWIDDVVAGAQPGARNAKAQFRGVLTRKDMFDRAAYLARTAQARAGSTIPMEIAAR